MALQLNISLSSPKIGDKFPSKFERVLPIQRSSITSGRRVNYLRRGKFPFTKIECSVEAGAGDESLRTVKQRSVSVVLLAGGKGKRMGANMPKQYLPLLGKPIALYSLHTFSQMIEVKEIVVVCDPSYRDVFEDTSDEIPIALKFALPGKERQDSVFSGFQEIDGDSKLVCIHDSARPLVTSEDIKKVLKNAWLTGAAVLGVPVKATIKEANSESYVVRTLDRKTLWEMQTPQPLNWQEEKAAREKSQKMLELLGVKLDPYTAFMVIKPDLLKDGFDLVHREGLEVTDDVSIVEHLKYPVYITEGSYTNIKVTTPDDLLLAERILKIGA